MEVVVNVESGGWPICMASSGDSYSVIKASVQNEAALSCFSFHNQYQQSFTLNNQQYLICVTETLSISNHDVDV